MSVRENLKDDGYDYADADIDEEGAPLFLVPAFPVTIPDSLPGCMSVGLDELPCLEVEKSRSRQCVASLITAVVFALRKVQ